MKARMDPQIRKVQPMRMNARNPLNRASPATGDMKLRKPSQPKSAGDEARSSAPETTSKMAAILTTMLLEEDEPWHASHRASAGPLRISARGGPPLPATPASQRTTSWPSAEAVRAHCLRKWRRPSFVDRPGHSCFASADTQALQVIQIPRPPGLLFQFYQVLVGTNRRQEPRFKRKMNDTA